MKLFVDDNREAPEGWTLAKTITDACRAIATFQFDEISLDHDIEGYEQENFTPVAYFIGALYQIRHTIPKITLHTGNPVGAERMKQILGYAGIESIYSPYNKN